MLETEILANLIEQKHGVLSRLRQLARYQVEMIQTGDMTQLLTLLATKQSFLHQLQELELQLDPFRSQDPDSRRWASGERRQQARDMAERCESLLSEIMLVEQQSEGDLVVRRDAAARRLQGFHSVTQAADAYRQEEDHYRQLDLSSDS